MSTIVVGVDGSSGSVRALQFAIDEARVHGSELKAVAAWEIPIGAYSAGWVPVNLDAGDFENIAKNALDKALEEVGADASSVSVTPIVRRGQAADVLLAESNGAELLVVGSRGLGGFKGLLLGSVSQQCVHHAKCPIAIVPADRSA